MDLTNPHRVGTIYSRPEDYLTWISKIKIPDDLLKVLLVMNGRIVMEFSGKSNKPYATVVESDSGKFIGDLEWFTKVFTVHKFYRESYKAAELFGEEESAIKELATVLTTEAAKVKRKKKVDISAKKLIIKEHLRKIRKMKENWALYLEAMKETHTSSSGKAICFAILNRVKKAIQVMIECSHKLIWEEGFNIKEWMKDLKIPTWITEKFSSEITKDSNGRLPKRNDMISHFYPANFNSGMMFTSEEVMDEDFIIENMVFVKNNETFLEAVRIAITNVELPTNEKSKKNLEKRIAKTRWHLRPPFEDLKELFQLRMTGRGIATEDVFFSQGLEGDAAIEEKAVNSLKKLDHVWNSVLRFQIAGENPVIDFWAKFFPTESWDENISLNPYFWILENFEKSLPVLRKIHALEGKDIRRKLNEYFEQQLVSAFKMRRSTLTKIKQLVRKPTTTVSIDDHCTDKWNTEIPKPSPENIQLAARLIGLRNQTIFEKKTVPWDGVMKPLEKNFKEFVDMVGVGPSIKKWLEENLSKNSKAVNEVIYTTLEYVINQAREDYERENQNEQEQAVPYLLSISDDSR